MRRIWVPQVIVTAMLLWAQNPENSHGYYILLQWVCCLLFTYLTVFALAEDNKGLAWLMGITAIIYNPIIPTFFTREVCSVINVAILLFVIPLSFFIKGEMNEEPSPVSVGEGQ